MNVSALDPNTLPVDELRPLYELRAVCHAEVNPREPFMSESDFVAFVRLPPASEPRQYWRALADGAAVGFAQLAPPAGSRVAHGLILVSPDARRQGVGTRLLEELRAAAGKLGATTIAGSVSSDEGRGFAIARGASLGRNDVRSLLELQRFQADHAHVAGYELRSWIDTAPDEYVASFAVAREAINDAPMEPGEWHGWDVARVRDLERVVAARGRETRVTAAIEDGAVVAYTELRVSRGGAVAQTEDTAVVASHRGRGLAYWIKNESLRLLQREHADVRVVATTNAESNAPILEVNRRLGFEPVLVSTACTVATSL